jgi:hypothetical protein
MSIANSFVSEPLAIESLIVDRSRVLNLSRPDLMRRASYKNIAKGLRRLERASSRRTQQDERPNSRTTRRSRGADRSGRAFNRADTSTNCRSPGDLTTSAGSSLARCIYAARHHPHRAKSATADLCRRFHRRRAAVAYRLRSCVGPSELRQQGSRRHSEQAIGIHERVRRKSRDPSRLRPPNWGDRELHPGSRRLVRSRRQPGRNVYARTLPGGHVHRAARKAGAAGNAASGHA